MHASREKTVFAMVLKHKDLWTTAERPVWPEQSEQVGMVLDKQEWRGHGCQIKDSTLHGVGPDGSISGSILGQADT